MPLAQEFLPEDRLLTIKEVCEIVPYTSVHIYRLMQQHEFPRAIKLGARRVAWIEREVLGWVNVHLAKREAS